ncbi:MAG: FecR family protein [Treponema sp.]
MKRIYIILLGLLITTLLFSNTGEVVAIKGKVELQKDGQWKLAQKGEQVDSGTLISTGFKSEVTLKVDGSTIIVQPLTRLRFDEIVKKGDVLSSKVYLDMGSIKANVKAAETKKVAFTVRTPVATASVRGTSGEISYNGILNGETGIWDYINQSGDVVKVFAGDTVSIDNFGNITPAQITFAQEVKPQTPTTMADKETDYVGVDEVKHNKEIDELKEASDVVISIGWED